MSTGNPSASGQTSRQSQSDSRRDTSNRSQPQGQGQRQGQTGQRPLFQPQPNRQHDSDARSLWPACGENVGSTERVVSAGLGGLLVASGIFRGRLPGLILTAAGASLLYRGLSGYCALYQQLGMNTCELDEQPADTQARGNFARGPLAGMMPHHDAIKGVKVEETFTVERSAHELYDAWTQWEKLPELLPHIKSIEVVGDKKTRWTALAPLGMQLRWDAEIIKQEADRMVSWKSTSGDVATAGSVHFEAKGDKSTEVRVSMQYDPPGGKAVAAVAEFFNMGLDKRVREDLQQFKDRLEKRPIQPKGTSGSE